MRRGSRLAIALPPVACVAAIVVLATAGSHPRSHRGPARIIAGREAGEQTNAIFAVDPSTGYVAIAGRLPTPPSDATVATTADDVIVAEGKSPSGAERSVFRLLPRIPR